jgi:hypothetical protein
MGDSAIERLSERVSERLSAFGLDSLTARFLALGLISNQYRHIHLRNTNLILVKSTSITGHVLQVNRQKRSPFNRDTIARQLDE